MVVKRILLSRDRLYYNLDQTLKTLFLNSVVLNTGHPRLKKLLFLVCPVFSNNLNIILCLHLSNINKSVKYLCMKGNCKTLHVENVCAVESNLEKICS